MADFIVAGIILVIVLASIAYIAKAKKKGVKCIGCPAAGQCTHQRQNQEAKCSCGCHADIED